MIALATCSALPDGDPDDAPLPAALGGARFAVWDDPAVDWQAFDLVVVRSTWDYHDRRDAFLAWARSVGDRLVNPPEVLAWNTDKRYLAELPRAVPTKLVEPGEAYVPAGREVVVKPTVSAGSRLTARFGAAEQDRAAALVETIHAAGKTAMVQPYLDSVDARGETALLFFGGSFSHAVRKGPILRPGAEPTPDLFAAEDLSARAATAAELELAAEVLAAVRERFGHVPVYARVDVVEGDGGPLLLELELTEPSLFLAHGGADAAARFAAAVLDHRS
jgi:glutathione synthase/RimK-type ligase-like ATP-grasp enzyme